MDSSVTARGCALMTLGSSFLEVGGLFSDGGNLLPDYEYTALPGETVGG